MQVCPSKVTAVSHLVAIVVAIVGVERAVWFGIWSCPLLRRREAPHGLGVLAINLADQEQIRRFGEKVLPKVT